MRFDIRKRQLVLLLGALLLVLIAFPYVQGSFLTDVLLNVLQAVIVVVAIIVVSTDRSHFVAGTLLGALSLFSGWVPRSQEIPWLFVLSTAGSMAFYAFAIVMISGYVLQDDDVTVDMFAGALCSYLLIGFLWTEAYNLLEYLHPVSFLASQAPGHRQEWSDLLYFSFTTLTGAGYGDIIPGTAKARSAAMLESVTGVLYVAVMIARLIGLHSARRTRHG